MVSSTGINAIIGVLGTGTTVLVISTFWIWRHVANLDEGEDLRKVNELENERWSTVSAELGSLHLSIEEYLDDSDGPEDVPREEHIITVIEREVDPNELEDVVETLRAVGEIEDLYDDHVDCYEASYGNFGKAAFTLFGIDGIFAATLFTESDPMSSTMLLVWFVTGFLVVNYVYDGISNFRSARDAKRRFRGEWHDYRRSTPELDFEV